MRSLPRALVAGGLGFATSLIIAACGGGAGLLSSDQANSLSNGLDQVSSAVSAGNCGAANSASQNLVSAVSNLPSTVNTTLRQDLNQGVSTVGQLASRDCHTTSTSTTTPTTTTPTASTATTVTTPTTTPTTTAQTITTATTPTTTGTTTTPGSGGGGLSGSGGGGGGLPGNGNGNGQ